MEEWKDIPGYEGLYQASTHGNIRSVDGKITSNAKCPIRVWKQRVLKQKHGKRKNKSLSDARVNLWKDGAEKTYLVSRLVAMTWCDGYKDGMTVNHIDGNPANNHCDNLEWLSKADNIRHGFDSGLYGNAKRCVLIDDDMKEYVFRSISVTAKFLDKSNVYVSKRIAEKRDLISRDGKKYKVVA